MPNSKDFWVFQGMQILSQTAFASRIKLWQGAQTGQPTPPSSAALLQSDLD